MAMGSLAIVNNSSNRINNRKSLVSLSGTWTHVNTIPTATNKDPDELVPVPKISLPALQTGQNAQDCNQLYNYGVSQNAVYVISPNGSSPLKARWESTNQK